MWLKPSRPPRSWHWFATKGGSKPNHTNMTPTSPFVIETIEFDNVFEEYCQESVSNCLLNAYRKSGDNYTLFFERASQIYLFGKYYIPFAEHRKDLQVN